MEESAVAIPIPSSRKIHNLHQKKKKKDFTDSDMAAAQQLMQLSDEENSNSKVDMAADDEEVVDQRLLMMMMKKKNNNNVNVNIMEEIFGKEDHVFCRAKKRRYRSLADIYMETTSKIKPYLA
ncbi:hypothetical protein FNV43_RR18792 [Rhamnella rubrinervis]|uniref:Uncharacterized protein n=1 Tax=Rhamnella rubrinervis TaxID=2594499 RepID=A0A8K0E5S3_9ROSA|nr:hypothetical protein FNV43_RR18792 [Rhamnella rubrinervis]